MPTPFPGMDPYLESPLSWPDLHNRLIAGLADQLGEALPPAYYARIDERTYVAEVDDLVFIGRPDVVVVAGPEGRSPVRRSSAAVLSVEVPVEDRVRETFLEVRLSGVNEVVTVLEILSPANKRPGEGRALYLQKRRHILASRSSLVEVDLLRAGEPMPVRGSDQTADYRILAARGALRPKAELMLFGVRDPIPVFRLPLRGEPGEPDVDLGSLLHRIYDRARYAGTLDYRGECVPPLEKADREWAEQLLQAAGRR